MKSSIKNITQNSNINLLIIKNNTFGNFKFPDFYIYSVGNLKNIKFRKFSFKFRELQILGSLPCFKFYNFGHFQ